MTPTFISLSYRGLSPEGTAPDPYFAGGDAPRVTLEPDGFYPDKYPSGTTTVAAPGRVTKPDVIVPRIHLSACTGVRGWRVGWAIDRVAPGRGNGPAPPAILCSVSGTGCPA